MAESENPVLWRWILTYDFEIVWVSEIVMIHVPAKFHQAEYSDRANKEKQEPSCRKG